MASNLAGAATTLTAAVSFCRAPLPPDWSQAIEISVPVGGLDHDHQRLLSRLRGGFGGRSLCRRPVFGNVLSIPTAPPPPGIHLTAVGTYGGAALVKDDTNGHTLWAVGLTNNQLASYSYAACVAPAPGNGAYLTSVLVGTNWLGTNQFSNTGADSILLSRFDANGSNIWSQLIGASNNVFNLYNTLVSDASGNVTVAGIISGTVDLGGTNITAPSGQMGFLAQYDPNGVVRWAQIFPNFPVNLASGGGQIYFQFASHFLRRDQHQPRRSLQPHGPGLGSACLNATNGQAVWLRGVGEQYGAN